ncbi:MAG: DNA repair protein RecN [Bacteroidetes bacterium]|nr:DNA repair protein RecN [Bacteroidota bacterium]
MLKSLYIKNYALIRELQVNFSDNLTIISGETGAGKSVLLGALSLVLGNRTDAKSIGDPSSKCVIEAAFDISGLNLEGIFAENDIDFENESLFRREIAPGGKSRAFINDTPVQLPLIRDIANKLIDIHSQHETLALVRPAFHLEMIDNFAGNDKLLASYTAEFRKYLSLKKQLTNLISDKENSKRDLDYWNFQFEELSAANLVAGELSEKEKELALQVHAGEIAQHLNEGIQLVNGEGDSILSLINALKSLFSKISKFTETTAELSQRTETLIVEIKDIYLEMEKLNTSIIVQPEKIDELAERCDLLNRLLKKHQQENEDGLIAYMTELEENINRVEQFDDLIESTNKELQAIEGQMETASRKLSEIRLKAVAKFSEEVQKSLTGLGMPKAKVTYSHQTTETYTDSGTDKISLLFSANPGSTPTSIASVASGGELSRLMLAVKSLVTAKRLLPTVIFDEIDAGISGAVAEQAGDIMRKMADSIQVVCITHLPQIASKGQHHFLVTKDLSDVLADVRITKLSEKERINEIARMLSGEKLSKEAIANARQLLGA